MGGEEVRRGSVVIEKVSKVPLLGSDRGREPGRGRMATGEPSLGSMQRIWMEPEAAGPQLLQEESGTHKIPLSKNMFFFSVPPSPPSPSRC